MSIADLWDRTFWGIVITIFIGLLWLKFLDPLVPCVGPGLVVALIGGGIYVFVGVRKMRAETKKSADR